MRLSTSLPSVLVTVLAAGPLSAQSGGGVTLQLPPTALAAARGDAQVVGGSVDAMLANPARTGVSRGVTISLGRFAGASTQGTLATSTALGPVSVGFFASWLDFGSDGVVPRIADLTVRGPVDASSLVAGTALAMNLLGFRLGAALSYGEDRLPGGRVSAALYDFGVSRTVAGLQVGLAVQHLGSDFEIGAVRRELPTRVSLGVRPRVTRIGAFLDLNLAAGLARERGGRITPSAVAELTYEPVQGWTGTVRLGARRVDGSGDPALQPIVVGGSLGLDRFALDYAFESYRGTGAVHRIGIRIE
ncbi:MAG: hypothetical protein AB7R55_00915 [Gemmatimonadales bacterium]